VLFTSEALAVRGLQGGVAVAVLLVEDADLQFLDGVEGMLVVPVL